MDRKTVLVPPLNFSLIAPGIYRSGYPNKKNFPFLRKLSLQSILYHLDPFESHTQTFGSLINCQQLEGSKEPFKELNHDLIREALVKVLDKRNHPILVHCNKGKHRIGCLAACIRKLENWSLSATLDEYRRFSGASGSKIKMDDQEFIQVFDQSRVNIDHEYAPEWLKL